MKALVKIFLCVTCLALSACAVIVQSHNTIIDRKLYVVKESYVPNSFGPDVSTYEVEVDGVTLSCGYDIGNCAQIVRDHQRARNAVDDPSQTPQARKKHYKGDIELTYDGFQGGA